MDGTLSESERAQIEHLLTEELDTLYIRLAQSAPEYADILFAPDEAKRAGEHLIDRFTPQLRQRLCVEWDYCARRHDPDLADTVALVAAVADLLVTLAHGLPVTTVAVILVKKGLNLLCACADDGRD